MTRSITAITLLLLAVPALGSDAPRFTLDETMSVGPADAPVVAVEYACPRCPHCKETTLRLHEAVESGALKGKVRLYFRPFPIRGKEGAAQAALGMVAEGVLNTESIHQAAHRAGVRSPLIDAVYGILYEGKEASHGLNDLLQRELRAEND